MTPALWFHGHGVHVFPVQGKVPAVPRGTSWKDWRGDVTRLDHYAVALGLLAVVDSDSPTAEAWVTSHLPATPFTVTTGPYRDGSPGRGQHRYYRLEQDAPPFIHRDGHTIEFKRHGQYVVGPGSRHPKGVTYEAAAWSWRWQDIPYFSVADFCFDDGSCGAGTSAPGAPYEIPEVCVSAGQRHYELFRFLRHVKSFADDKAQARQYVSWFNRQRCQPPLDEDQTFERWFDRAWHQRDRPFDHARPAAPLGGLRDVGELL